MRYAVPAREIIGFSADHLMAAFLVTGGLFLVMSILGWYAGNVILWMRNKRS
jgi:hypothetical protein